MFRPAALASDNENLMANRAFARSGQAYLKSGEQFGFFKHALCCHKFAWRILSAEVTQQDVTNHVVTDVLICPVERSSTVLEGRKLSDLRSAGQMRTSAPIWFAEGPGI